MIAEPVDVLEESRRSDAPVYRVHFWFRPAPGWAAHCWEWRLREARDVFEVVEWADAERGDRTYELFVEEWMPSHPESTAVTIVRLAGDDVSRTGVRLTLEVEQE